MDIDNNLPEERIKCNNCGKTLMNIFVHPNKESNMVHNIQATCPFCGDRSEVHRIYGEMYQGPVDEESSSFPTTIKDIEMLEDKTVFIIEKARKH